MNTLTYWPIPSLYKNYYLVFLTPCRKVIEINILIIMPQACYTVNAAMAQNILENYITLYMMCREFKSSYNRQTYRRCHFLK